MKLICGFAGVSSEQIRLIRSKAGMWGIDCKVGEVKGKVGFIGEATEKGWENLLKLIKHEEGIIPMYFMVQNRIVSLEYGKKCIEAGDKVNVYAARLRPIKSIIRTILVSRISYINKIKK